MTVAACDAAVADTDCAVWLWVRSCSRSLCSKWEVVESHTWKMGRNILLQLHDEFAELLDRVFVIQTGSF